MYEWNCMHIAENYYLIVVVVVVVVLIWQSWKMLHHFSKYSNARIWAKQKTSAQMYKYFSIVLIIIIRMYLCANMPQSHLELLYTHIVKDP